MREVSLPADFEGSFALCLTHDVDRPYKTYQSLFYALAERRLSHLEALLPGVNPYWQFEELMALETDLGVRSAFYFLNPRQPLEHPPRNWVRPIHWLEHLGGYDLRAPAIARAIRELDDGGWEVGLHGSYDTHRDRERLRHEKQQLERVLGHEVLGGRQHYLRLADPPTETWTHHRAIGLGYDASLGSSTEYGFGHGYGVKRPFGDEFLVFPLTIMEVALANAPGVDPESAGIEPSSSDPKKGAERANRTRTTAGTSQPCPRSKPQFDRARTSGIAVEPAWRECDRILREAAANDAVMTVLWHPRYFSTEDFPGYRELYRRLVERALELGAWVGPPGELYATLANGGKTDGSEDDEPNRDERNAASGRSRP